MEIQRTANAGVLLKLDGVAILLDGLCDRVEGYLPTPAYIVQQLQQTPPDILAFTHSHADHCSEALLLPYRKQNLRPILGPESLLNGTIMVGSVKITPVASRHLGKVEPGLQHVSYIIEGSRTVWFLGDAAPVQWRNRIDLPRPDVLLVPYAYANTRSVWEMTAGMAEKVVLLHLPNREEDAYGLWNAVEIATRGCGNLYIPKIGDRIAL